MTMPNKEDDRIMNMEQQNMIEDETQKTVKKLFKSLFTPEAIKQITVNKDIRNIELVVDNV